MEKLTIKRQQVLDQALSYLGKKIHVIMDRPIGTVHPKHKDVIYPINYGYIPGVLGGDNEELDVFIIDVNTPLKECDATVIGISHRINDEEDKLIAVVNKLTYTKEEIAKKIEFQECYYQTELILK